MLHAGISTACTAGNLMQVMAMEHLELLDLSLNSIKVTIYTSSQPRSN